MGLSEKELFIIQGGETPLKSLHGGRRMALVRSVIKGALSALVIFGILMVAEEARTQQAGFQVVAHPSLALDSIAKKDLARIFLKRKKVWLNGEPATPIDQKTSSAVREAFSLEILGKGMNAVESFWNGQVFSGKEGPPQSMASDAEVIVFVMKTPGAVGYVSAGAAISGVKVLRIAD